MTILSFSSTKNFMLPKNQHGLFINMQLVHRSRHIIHYILYKRTYLSSAIFLVCPEPKVSARSHRSVNVVPSEHKFTSITCILIAALELLNSLDNWNFLHFFSENGFLIMEEAGSMLIEKFWHGCDCPSSHVDIDTCMEGYFLL